MPVVRKFAVPGTVGVPFRHRSGSVPASIGARRRRCRHPFCARHALVGRRLPVAVSPVVRSCMLSFVQWRVAMVGAAILIVLTMHSALSVDVATYNVRK